MASLFPKTCEISPPLWDVHLLYGSPLPGAATCPWYRNTVWYFR